MSYSLSLHLKVMSLEGHLTATDGCVPIIVWETQDGEVNGNWILVMSSLPSTGGINKEEG